MIKKWEIRGAAALLIIFLTLALWPQRASAASLSRTSLNMTTEITYQLKLKNASGKVSWSSSRSSVASVSKTGLVKAKKVGSCTIRAVNRGRVYYCSVTVRKPSKSLRKARASSTGKYQNRIVLAGSSSMYRWNTCASAFAPYKVLKTAISGSTTVEWLQYYQDLIVDYDPTAIVLYVGTNDIENGRSVSGSTNAANTIKLIKLLRKKLPDVPIFYISINTCWGRRNAWNAVAASNKIMAEYCSKKKGVYYINTNAAMVGSNGRPRRNLFLSDQIHPSSAGYEIWNAVVGTTVQDVLLDLDILPQETGATDAQVEASGLLTLVSDEDIQW